MSNNNKWEALSLRDRAFLMREGIRNGITDLNEIRDLYNQSHQFSGEEGTKLKEWKALQNIKTVADPNFNRSNTGTGSIEYFAPDQNKITYPNNYTYKHPSPGEHVIVYNPTENDEQDIRLDTLHAMPALDEKYAVLNDLYRIAARNSDVMYNAKERRAEDINNYGENNVDSLEDYFNNEADGLLRNMLIEGSPEYLKSKRYYPDKEHLKEWNKSLLPYIQDIQNYLEKQEWPEHIVEPIIVTPKNNKQEHKFSGEDNVPTRDEYITSRASEVINTALDKARNRTALSSPIIGYERISQDYINTAEKELNRNKSKLYQLRQELDASPNDASLNTRYKDIVAVVADQEKQFKQLNYYFKNNIARPLTGANCIWTITGDYNRPVSGNETFKVNHTQKGFKQIPVTEIKEGDIVQFARDGLGPNHAMMANTAYTTNPRDMRYNGSNGDYGIRINAKYPHEWKNTRAYRFVGTPEEVLQWDKDYYKTYDSNDLIKTDNIFLNKVENVLQSDLSKKYVFSGEENISNKTYISTKPKNNIKTGNVEFDLFDFNTWRYHNSPIYSNDTDFTLAFTDALLDGEKNFKWGDNYYSTEIDYNKKFTRKDGRKPFEEFANYMYPAVIQVLQENNMPIDMAHNIVRQAAMESDYGLSPRGGRGYNLSGIKWTEKAGGSGYEYTKEADGEKYIDFKDLKEYLNYKVRTLQNNYNALNANSVHDYVEALHPKAFGKKPRSKNYKGDYSAGASNYKKSMTGMSSLDKTLMNELYFPLFKK